MLRRLMIHHRRQRSCVYVCDGTSNSTCVTSSRNGNCVWATAPESTPKPVEYMWTLHPAKKKYNIQRLVKHKCKGL